MALMQLEVEILDSIPRDGVEQPRAYVAWEGNDGEVEMGPCRYAYSDGRLSVSPFPGAWVIIERDKVRRVHHLGAMSLGPLPAWNRPCAVCGCQGQPHQ